MANKDHLSRLKDNIEGWNSWRLENPNVPIDLSGADLKGARLVARQNSSIHLGSNLREVRLLGVNLTLADLSGADLRNAYLNAARLWGATLNGTNLRGADMRDADLAGVELVGADLSGANLRRARFATFWRLAEDDCSSDPPGAIHVAKRNLTQLSAEDIAIEFRGEQPAGGGLPNGTYVTGFIPSSCRMSETNLTGANLQLAVLLEAVLQDVTIERAIFGRTLINCDLSRVSGLSTIEHRAPSELLMRPGTVLPLEFLRGCGWSDWQIEAARLYREDLSKAQVTDIASKIARIIPERPIQYYSCFISYSREDQEFAHSLHDALQNEGIRCWLDELQMLPGDDIYEQVDRGIRLWDKVLLCCSRSSLEKSWWVDNEIDIAFEKERTIMKERGKKVLALIPIDLDGFMFSDEWRSGKKQQVRSRLAADFRDWRQDKEKYDQQFKKIVRALHVGDAAREIPPPSFL